jgi:hypothetical protein
MLAARRTARQSSALYEQVSFERVGCPTDAGQNNDGFLPITGKLYTDLLYDDIEPVRLESPLHMLFWLHGQNSANTAELSGQSHT